VSHLRRGVELQAGLLLRRFADLRKVRLTVNVCEPVEFAFAQGGVVLPGGTKVRAPTGRSGRVGACLPASRWLPGGLFLGSGVPALQILEKIKEGNYDIALLRAGSTRWLDNFLPTWWCEDRATPGVPQAASRELA